MVVSFQELTSEVLYALLTVNGIGDIQVGPPSWPSGVVDWHRGKEPGEPLVAMAPMRCAGFAGYR